MVMATPALAAPREMRVGVAPRLPGGTELVAGVASVRTMRITVALAPRDPIALNTYAKAVGEPSSPDYRHYLTPTQFRKRFAPRRQALVRVEEELRDNGLHPSSVSANGLEIHLRASGAAVEHAFSVTLAKVRLPDGRDAIFNPQAPALDAKVAPVVQAVIGLSSLARMQRLDAPRAAVGPRAADLPRAAVAPRSQRTRGARTSSAHIATGGPRPCARAAEIAPGQGAYTADQIADAYGFSGVYRTGDLGQGVTIGLYELEPDSPSDIAAYQACYGTDAKVSYEKVDDGNGSGVGQGEAALDIEQLIGLAPRANIIVYQGPNNNSDRPGTGPYDTLAAMVSEDRAQVLSNSWGECETLEGSADAHAESTLLQEAATQGQTFVSVAGDSGSEDCWSPPPGGNLDNALSVDDPGGQDFATSVGGTTLTSLGPPPTESVWDDDNPAVNYSRFGIQTGAGGGGISSLWTMPSYQAGAVSALGVLNSDSSGSPCSAPSGAYCREVPDVSADADPMTSYLDYWNGDESASHSESGWQGTGGTSAAAPVWAALFALADASRNCQGTLVGFANPALYALAGQSQATYFNDITTGNNDFTPSGNTAGLYPAEPGYDMASGLGSPKAAALVPALCQQAVRFDYPGDEYTFYGQHVRLRMRATPATGQSGPITYRALRLPAGLHIDPSTGVISGSVTQTGVRAVTVTALTSSGTYGAVQFSWSVERRPRLAAAVKGTAAEPTLTLQVKSGAYEPGLSKVTITLPSSVTLTRSSRAVQVLDTSGRALAHNAHFQDHVLTIKLVDARSPVRVEFPAGLLRARGTLTGPIAVAVETIDRVGGRVTLMRTLSRG